MLIMDTTDGRPAALFVYKCDEYISSSSKKAKFIDWIHRFVPVGTRVKSFPIIFDGTTFVGSFKELGTYLAKKK